MKYHVIAVAVGAPTRRRQTFAEFTTLLGEEIQEVHRDIFGCRMMYRMGPPG